MRLRFSLHFIWIVSLLGQLTPQQAQGALTDTLWQGAANGLYNTPANWSNGLATNAGRAVIDASLLGGSPVIYNTSGITMGGLSIASGFTFTRDGADTGNDTLTLNAATAADTFFSNAGTISSGGTSGSLTLTVNGSGSTLANSGTLEASAGTTLNLSKGQSTPSSINNANGTIRTVGNGILAFDGSGNSAWGISGGNLTNEEGTLNFLIRNPFTLTNVTFTNGGTANFLEPTLTSSGGYGIRLSGTSSLTNTGTINITRNIHNPNTGAKNAGILTGVATTTINNSGTINITTIGDSATSGSGFGGFDFTDPDLVYTLTNTGTINLESQSSTHNTVFNATSTTGTGVSIEGNGGEIVLKVGAGGSVNRIYFTGSNGVITHGAGHTIRGAGGIGINQIKTFTNNGTVRADDAIFALTLDPRGHPQLATGVGSFINNGSVEATGAGGLVLNDGKYTNDGTFQIAAASSLTQNKGVLFTNNAGRTLDIQGAWNSGTGGGGLIANAGAISYSSSANSTPTIGLTGAGTFTKSGTGSLTLYGANSLTGETTINAGTLVVNTGTGTALTASTTNGTYLVTVADTSTLVVGQLVTGTGMPANTRITGIESATQFTISNNANSTQAATALTAAAYSTLGSGALTVNGGTLDLSAGSHSVGAVTIAGGSITNGTLTGTSYGGQSGSVSATLAGAIGLDKTTGGTLVLSAANTYSGGTTISAGTLRVNNLTGSGTGSGAVSLGANGTLAGTGTLTGLVTTAATTSVIAAGNSPGTLTLSGGLDASAGTTFEFELGTISDLIVTTTFTGSLAPNGLIFRFADSGGIAAGVTYTLIEYAAAIDLDYTDLFADLSPGYVLDSSFGTGGFLIDDLNGLLQVQFSAIPEPSPGVLLVVGMGLAVALRRRRPFAYNK